MRSKTVTKPLRSRRPRPGPKIKRHTRGFVDKHLNQTAVQKYHRHRRIKARMARLSRRRNRAT